MENNERTRAVARGSLLEKVTLKLESRRDPAVSGTRGCVDKHSRKRERHVTMLGGGGEKNRGTDFTWEMVSRAGIADRVSPPGAD